jgi:hypothetical protein
MILISFGLCCLIIFLIVLIGAVSGRGFGGEMHKLWYSIVGYDELIKESIKKFI